MLIVREYSVFVIQLFYFFLLIVQVIVHEEINKPFFVYIFKLISVKVILELKHEF